MEPKTTEKAKTAEKAKATTKTKYGHIIGTQAGNIDEALIQSKKPVTVEELAKKLSLSTPRVKSHLAHLQKAKGLKFEVKDGAYLLLDK